jgi:membrane protein DedA with SNARE-associated domain
VDFASAVQQYGYAAVFLGSFLEGETVLALAGLAAHRGYLDLPAVIAIAVLGAFLGDQCAFFVGRRYGTRLVLRYPRLSAQVARADRLLMRYDAPLVIGLRFVYGLRLSGVIALGMTGLAWPRFAALNFIGALIWAPVVAGAGYVFGDVVQRLLGDLERVDHWVFAALAAIGMALWLYGRLRRGMRIRP